MTTTLYHLRDSHFSEKARWAMDLKRVPHTRRAPLPGTHMLVALALSQRPTLPVLVLEGEPIRDSRAIVAALDAHYPDPPLATDDPAARGVEVFCGEELASFLRRFSLYHLLQDADLCAAMTAQNAGAATRAALKATVPGLRRLLFIRYGITSASAGEARVRALAALDRLEAGIGDSGYLVGDRFTVADLTGAAMLGPLLRPAGSPWAPLPWLPPAIAELRATVEARPIGRWSQRMYAQHRTAPVSDRQGAAS